MDRTALRNAHIDIRTEDIPVFDEFAGGYTQFAVTANNFVIATFVDETSRLSYLEYLKKYGFARFPKSVLKTITGLSFEEAKEEVKIHNLQKHGRKPN